MYQEAVNAAIAVLEGMEKDECVGDGGGMHDGVDIARFHALVGIEQPGHERVQGIRLGADEVDGYPVEAHRLADVVLGLSVARIAKARVHDSVLKVDQGVPWAMVLLLGVLQQRDEPLGSSGIEFDMLDRERGLGFLFVQVAERPREQSLRIAGSDFAASSRQVSGFIGVEFLRAANRRAVPEIAQQVVVDPLAPHAATRRCRVVSGRVEQVHVTAARREVVEREPAAGQELVQIPRPAHVYAHGLRAHIGKHVGLRNRVEERGEDAEIRAVVLERELQLIAEPIPGPVCGRVFVGDRASVRVAAVDAPRQHMRRVPVGDDTEVEAFHQGGVAGRPTVSSARELCGTARHPRNPRNLPAKTVKLAQVAKNTLKGSTVRSP